MFGNGAHICRGSIQVAKLVNHDTNDVASPQSTMNHSRPLEGIRVLEFAGLAPGPFAGMFLADFGADIVRVDRPTGTNSDPLCRHKRSIRVDLRKDTGISVIKMLAKHADVIIEPFRPGVMEKLGLGPGLLCQSNPRLIYARMNGFRRQDAKRGRMAGHDINYIALSGVLSLLGPPSEKPLAPGNLLGDFAGGGLMCAAGILLALYARSQWGRGQVVEANMVDGASYIGTFARLTRETPLWDHDRGENILDGGAPFYSTYETKDKRFVAVGALEPQFYAALLDGLGLDSQHIPNRENRDSWQDLRSLFVARFRSKTLENWTKIFDGTDACVTPVLELHEVQPREAILLSDTPSKPPTDNGVLVPGSHSKEVLKDWLGDSDSFYVTADGVVQEKPKSRL